MIAQPPPACAPVLNPALNLESFSILVADDDANMSELLAANLRRLGHRVVGIASDGRQAVEMALRLKPDLVMMDIHMPDLDGLEASDAILSVQRVPIVFITGMANDRDLLRAIDQRVISYLIKPFGPAQLKVAVAFAIAQCSESALPAA